MTQGAGTAVVTGASSGIGAAYAAALAGRGYHLVLVARREHRLRQLAQAVGPEPAAEVLPADLTDAAAVDRVADRLRATDVTLLVNNAGINGYGPFAEVDPAVIDAVVRLNVLTPVHLARAVLPGLTDRGSGAVVNVASMLAFSGGRQTDRMPRRAGYAASKAFLVTFTRLLAAELAGTGVTAQVVCPGYTATEFHLTNAAAPVSDDLAAGRVDESWAMSAEQVVAASLAALDTGEVVCAPGLADPTGLARLTEAESALFAGTRQQLADRYRTG